MGVPAMIGAAAGAALNRRNPLQGAMLGGFLGGAGGAILPNITSTSASGLTPGILTSAESGSMMSATNPALVTSSLPSSPTAIGFQPTSTLAQTNIANEAAKQGLFAGTPKPVVLGGGPSSVEASILADKPSILSELGQYAQNNPTLTAMAAQSGQSLLSQQQPQVQSQGLMRGNPSQAQAPQYQVGVPRVSLI